MLHRALIIFVLDGTILENIVFALKEIKHGYFVSIELLYSILRLQQFSSKAFQQRLISETWALLSDVAETRRLQAMCLILLREELQMRF